MQSNYDLEVAFKNAVLRCIKELRDIYRFPELDLTIKDVQLETLNINYNKGEAIIVVPKLDDSLTPFDDTYGYQFQCTYLPKLEGTKEDCILIDVASITTREFTISGDNIDTVVHIEEDNA